MWIEIFRTLYTCWIARDFVLIFYPQGKALKTDSFTIINEVLTIAY